MNSVSFYTLGCRLNQSETAVLERSMQALGYRIAGENEPADIAVINTCTVTENGDTDTRRLVNRICRLNPRVRIALVGCQAQVQKEKLAALPNIRWIIGNARKMETALIIDTHVSEAGAAPQVITPPIPRGSFTVPVAGIDRRHTRANIKIQDGCDFFCSFCEIPYARGRARSREFEDILREAGALAAAGHQELVITGINVGTYQNAGYGITDVVEALEQIEGLERIRISSIEPTTIPRPLIRRMARKTKLCRHLHIPLQSASGDVLKAMKRRCTARDFHRFIQTVYETVPQVCIGTDLIAGFPGESEAHFQETLEALKKWPLHYAHVFSYSRRSMSQSRKLAREVPAQTIQTRGRILRELSGRKRRLFYESLLGTTQKVLFEQKKNGWWTGLTDNYVRVGVRSDPPLANELRTVRMEEIQGAFIKGVLSKEGDKLA